MNVETSVNSKLEPDLRYNKLYGELGSGAISTEPYISPEFFRKEKEKLFRKAWLGVCRADDLASPGDYRVIDLASIDASVIIVRGRDNVLRGFHNACPHRCNKILQPGSGKNKRAIMCNFHGWTFDLTGKLVDCPAQELFIDFDPSKRGLVPIALEVWEGFVFVSREPDRNLEQWLGPIHDRYAGYFDRFKLAGHFSTTLNANWKIIVDANNEAYHAPVLHRVNLRDAAAGKDNPNARFNSVRLYDMHCEMSLWGNPDYRPTAVEGLGFRYADRPLWPAMATVDETLPPGINPSRDPLWIFDLMIVFPTFNLLMARDYYLWVQYWPLAVDQTRIELMTFLEPAATAGQVFAQEYMLTHMHDTQREDWSTVEGTHQMMLTGAINELQLCDEEVVIRHNQRVLRDFVGE